MPLGLRWFFVGGMQFVCGDEANPDKRKYERTPKKIKGRHENLAPFKTKLSLTVRP